MSNIDKLLNCIYFNCTSIELAKIEARAEEERKLELEAKRLALAREEEVRKRELERADEERKREQERAEEERKQAEMKKKSGNCTFIVSLITNPYYILLSLGFHCRSAIRLLRWKRSTGPWSSRAECVRESSKSAGDDLHLLLV